MPGAEIKGSTFRMRSQYVRGRWGEDGLRAVLARLSPDEAAVVASATAVGFYPLALNAKLDDAICGQLAGGREEIWYELGAYSAHAFAQEIYHSFYQEREPRRFIETTTHLYKHYYRNAGRRRD
ncbi:MAG: heme NO-binding domain-containing protein [Acidobacteriota bacterium]